MNAPIILCVDADPATRAQIEREVLTRYGADYDVRFGSDGAAALADLRAWGAEARDVAVVLVDQAIPDAHAVDVLAQVRTVAPGARRGLLITAGDRAAQASLLRAATLGAIDFWLTKPTVVGLVEEFHHSVTDALYAWSGWHRPFEWVRLVGAPWSSESHAVRDLLARNGIPFGDYDAASAEGRALLEETGADPGRLPVLAMSDGQVLVQPSVGALAQALGVATRPDSGGYDVVVIGAGPAGLAAAVYAASEGLRTLVLEREALGGQAGTSSLIRNYLGFPMGLSGTEFAVRAFQQAMLFGVDFVFANGATAIGVNGGLAVRLVEGDDVPTRVVVLATGVSYRRLGIPALEHRIGAGVYYGAAVSEAEALAGLDVAIVGGGNSAGQAAMHLAQRARRVHLLVRGPSLAASMSDYLVRGLARASNVELHLHAEVVDGSGAGSLDALTVRDVRTGVERSIAARALFVLIGAEPTTGWLPPEIARDGWGYVLTGAEVDAGAERVGKAARPFETSLAGVFAVGDVRHGSTKRVASAVGEGSACISFVHERLANPG